MKRYIIVAALVIGGVLGPVGSFAPVGVAQNTLWAISGVGLIVGYLLLAARRARASQDEVAAGFVLSAIAEGLLFPVLGSSGADYMIGFAGSASLYCAGLLLISLPAAFPIWVRAAGAIASLLFGSAALLIYIGQPIALDAPIVSAAWMLLDVTIIGWIVTLLRQEQTVSRAERGAAVR